MDIDIVYIVKLRMFKYLNIIDITLIIITIVTILPINIKTFFQQYIKPNAYPKNKICLL